MPEKVINVYKKCGQTPLDCINEIKKEYPEMMHLPLTYAGRLDPLAEGVLLILVGDECLKKDEYLALSKEYELTILFGFATDTYDLMGVVNLLVPSADEFSGSRTRGTGAVPDNENSSTDFTHKIQKIIPQFTGRIIQAYPPYSSRTVNSKPLFQWAREGRLNEITIPSHEVFVENIEIIKEDFILGSSLLNKIKKDIGSVKGDFRQEEILSIWENKLKDISPPSCQFLGPRMREDEGPDHKNWHDDSVPNINKLENKYQTITLRVSCGSGVYVRSIANELGKKLGIPALALNIKRTKVGEFS